MLVESTIKPENIEITDTRVFINTDIKQIEREEEIFYVYEQKTYDKNEYILNLNTELLNTQMALCDIYELLEG